MLFANVSRMLERMLAGWIDPSPLKVEVSGSIPTAVIFPSAGVQAAVVDKGSVNSLVPYLIQGCRHGFQDLGVQSVAQLHQQLDDGTVNPPSHSSPRHFLQASSVWKSGRARLSKKEESTT